MAQQTRAADLELRVELHETAADIVLVQLGNEVTIPASAATELAEMLVMVARMAQQGEEEKPEWLAAGVH